MKQSQDRMFGTRESSLLQANGKAEAHHVTPRMYTYVEDGIVTKRICVVIENKLPHVKKISKLTNLDT